MEEEIRVLVLEFLEENFTAFQTFLENRDIESTEAETIIDQLSG